MITMDTSTLHKELKFRTSRSSGSGGQHVNKVATRVELLFDVMASQQLDEAQKQRVQQRLANRITKEGILLLECSETRSQHRNKELVTEQFDQLLAEALKAPKRRKKVPDARQAAPQSRLQEKRRRAEKKAWRGPVSDQISGR